ncbi:MAG: diguanylate cyclase domain-containing protein [Clostridia bacterium]
MNEMLLKEKIDKTNIHIYSLRNSSELNLIEAIATLEDNLSLAKSLDYHQGIVECYRLLSILYSYNGQTSLCYQALDNALKFHNKYELDEKTLANIYAAFVVFYLEVKRDYEIAIKYCQKGLALSKSNMFRSLIWKFTLNFGVAYLELGMLEQAQKAFEEALSLGKSERIKRAQLYAYANLAELHYKRNNIDLARKNHEEAYDLALEMDDIIVLSSIAHVSAAIEIELGNVRKACQLLQKTIERLRKNKQKTWVTHLSLELINYYIKDSEYQKAKQLLDKIETNILDLENDEFAAKYFLFSSIYYERVNKYKKSLEYYKLYNMYNKRLLNKQAKEVANTIKEEAMQETIESLRVLSSVGQEITAYDNLDDIFLEVNKHISSIFSNYNFVVALKNKDELDCIYYRYLDKNLPLFSIKINNKNSFLSSTIRKDEMIVVNDLINEHSKYVEDLIHLDTNRDIPQSLLSIPLKVLDETIGVMQVQAYRKDVFNNHNIEFFTIVGSYTAIAIRNSVQVKELREMVNYDSLTGLKNFHCFNKMLYDIVQDANYKHFASLLIIDIDHFKFVNDTYGHNIGNDCLQRVGKLIEKQFLDDSNIAARIGGEEFGILITDTDEHSVTEKAENLLNSFRNTPVCKVDREIYISISIGIGISNSKRITADELFALADSALYIAKESGRNQIVTLRY